MFSDVVDTFKNKNSKQLKVSLNGFVFNLAANENCLSTNLPGETDQGCNERGAHHIVFDHEA